MTIKPTPVSVHKGIRWPWKLHRRIVKQANLREWTFAQYVKNSVVQALQGDEAKD